MHCCDNCWPETYSTNVKEIKKNFYIYITGNKKKTWVGPITQAACVAPSLSVTF
jgi:hypothetical protein